MMNILVNRADPDQTRQIAESRQCLQFAAIIGIFVKYNKKKKRKEIREANVNCKDVLELITCLTVFVILIFFNWVFLS